MYFFSRSTQKNPPSFISTTSLLKGEDWNHLIEKDRVLLKEYMDKVEKNDSLRSAKRKHDEVSMEIDKINQNSEARREIMRRQEEDKEKHNFFNNYFNSPEAKALFNPMKNETCSECLVRRGELLLNASTGCGMTCNNYDLPKKGT